MIKRSILIGILLAGVIVGLGIFLAFQHDNKKINVYADDQFTITVFSEPRYFPQFTLTDDNKQIFTNSQLDDHWTLMFFGFTNCGGICPTTMAELAKVFRLMPESVQQYHPQLVFVTVDPVRDTPEKMHAYLNTFHPNFIGLTGEPSSLAKLRRQLGILAMDREPNGKESQDNIDHSGTILLINPRGQYVGVFSMPHDAKAIVDDMILLMKTDEG